MKGAVSFRQARYPLLVKSDSSGDATHAGVLDRLQAMRKSPTPYRQERAHMTSGIA